MWVKKRSNKKERKTGTRYQLGLSWQRQIGKKSPPPTHTQIHTSAPNRTQCRLPLRTVWLGREGSREGRIILGMGAWGKERIFSWASEDSKEFKNQKWDTTQRSTGKWVRGQQNMVGTDWIQAEEFVLYLFGWPASLPWARRRIKSDWTKAIDTGKGKLLVCL